MIPCVEVTASVAGAPQTRGASLIAMFLGLRNTSTSCCTYLQILPYNTHIIILGHAYIFTFSCACVSRCSGDSTLWGLLCMRLEYASVAMDLMALQLQLPKIDDAVPQYLFSVVDQISSLCSLLSSLFSLLFFSLFAFVYTVLFLFRLLLFLHLLPLTWLVWLAQLYLSIMLVSWMLCVPTAVLCFSVASLLIVAPTVLLICHIGVFLPSHCCRCYKSLTFV